MAEKKPKKVQPDEEESSLGNAVASPRYEKSDNPIVAEIDRFNFAEKTQRDSPYWPESQLKPYNPDDLVQRNADYSIYEEMSYDDQVNICLQIKKGLVLGSGFDFICEDDSDISKEIKKELQIAFNEEVETEIEDCFEEILSAYEFGFSITEKVWKQKEDGKFTIKSLKSRHPATFLLHTDEYGNVSRYEQRGTKIQTVDIPPNAIMHFINNSKFQNPYGTSDLRAAFEAWFIKKQIIKFYAIFLEKAASPTPVARYGTTAPPEAVNAIYEAIRKLQSKTALAIPKDIEMEFLEASSNGEAYVKGINIFNMFIGRALFVPDLLGFQGSETSGGSYSLGKDQLRVMFKHIERRRRAFEKLINKDLVRPFVVNNYGPQEQYPKFRLKPLDDEEATKLAELWFKAVNGKIYEPNDEEIKYFRDLVKFPNGEVKRPEAPAPFGSNPLDPAGKPMKPGQEKDDLENDEEESEDESNGETSKEEQQETKGEQKEVEKYSKVYPDTPGDYHKKVDFKAVKSLMDQARIRTMAEVSPIVREVFDDLFIQIRKKKIVQSQDISKVDSIKVKRLNALKSLLKQKMLGLHKDAMKQAAIELGKGVGYEAPLPHEDFLKFLEMEVFSFIGKYEYTIKERVKLALIQAIKDGKPLNTVIGLLDDEGIPLAETQIERFARTKFTEVMNRGRMEYFESTGVVAAYQFTAIIDDRVTEVCDGLHGKVFEKDDAPIPPLHFNCRSVLIPITKYEPYKADKTVDGQNIDKFIDDNIGDGFSRQ